MENTIWEILIPQIGNTYVEYPFDHYMKWFKFVQSISTGIPLINIVDDTTISQRGKMYTERMKTCRIICNEEEINKIVEFTVKNYDMEEIIAYKISSNVIIKYKDGT